jgi:Pregnancy-associated plasma protein-A
VACYDDNNNFLCKLTNGTQVSNTRWWRSKSRVVAHEFGHLMGLFHTFDTGCDTAFGNTIPDIPVEELGGDDNCPGLLPYNKDRDLFNRTTRISRNKFQSPDQCGGTNFVCDITCAACCDTKGEETCNYFNEFESVSQEDQTRVCCPNENIPTDSCRQQRGIDPKNNVMSYAPDYCIYELSPGQMVRMMAQIRKYKSYIYCNYANNVDVTKCINVPCASIATSPICNK